MKRDLDWAIRQKQLADVNAIEDVAMEPWLVLYRECEQQRGGAIEPGEFKIAWPCVPGMRLVVPSSEEVNTAERREAVIAFCRKTLALVGAKDEQQTEELTPERKDWEERRNLAAVRRNWSDILQLCWQRVRIISHEIAAKCGVSAGEQTSEAHQQIRP